MRNTTKTGESNSIRTHYIGVKAFIVGNNWFLSTDVHGNRPHETRAIILPTRDPIVDTLGSSEPRKIEALRLPRDMISIRTGIGTRMQPAEFGILRTTRLCPIRAKARKERKCLPSKVNWNGFPVCPWPNKLKPPCCSHSPAHSGPKSEQPYAQYGKRGRLRNGNVCKGVSDSMIDPEHTAPGEQDGLILKIMSSLSPPLKLYTPSWETNIILARLIPEVYEPTPPVPVKEPVSKEAVNRVVGVLIPKVGISPMIFMFPPPAKL